MMNQASPTSLMPMIEDAYRVFNKRNAVSLKTMVDTFEKRKNAYVTKNQTRKQTGLLDMKKLVEYKTNDRIFAKKIVKPEGKHHKVVVMLDWSDSISQQLAPIIMQSITIAQWCKRCGIEFSIMGFADCRNELLRSVTQNSSTNELDNEFMLMEFLSSSMNKREFDEGCFNLFSLINGTVRGESGMNLNSTPLTASLVAVRDIVSQERARFQSYTLIILTDGESNHLYTSTGSSVAHSGRVMLDPKTNKVHTKEDVIKHSEHGHYNSSAETNLVLSFIKEMDVKTFMFFFYDGRPQLADVYENEKLSKDAYHMKKFFIHTDEVYYLNSGVLFSIPDEITNEVKSELVEEDDDEEIDWDDEDSEDGYDWSHGLGFEVSRKSSVRTITNKLVRSLAEDNIKRLVAQRLVKSICENYK